MARLLLVIGASLVTFGYSRCVFISGDGGAIAGSSGSGFGNDFSTSLVLRDSTRPRPIPASAPPKRRRGS